jgi:hypothetical protein
MYGKLFLPHFCNLLQMVHKDGPFVLGEESIELLLSCLIKFPKALVLSQSLSSPAPTTAQGPM